MTGAKSAGPFGATRLRGLLPIIPADSLHVYVSSLLAASQACKPRSLELYSLVCCILYPANWTGVLVVDPPGKHFTTIRPCSLSPGGVQPDPEFLSKINENCNGFLKGFWGSQDSFREPFWFHFGLQNPTHFWIDFSIDF